MSKPLCAQHRSALHCRPPLNKQSCVSLQCVSLHERSVRRASAAQAAEACQGNESSSSHLPSTAAPTASHHPRSSETLVRSFLEALTITNFALVAHSSIRFQPGLNVLSGASGAGKSVLLQALGVVLGMPVDKDMIRDQEGRAGAQRHCVPCCGWAFRAAEF